MSNRVSHLIFDCEAVADGKLIRKQLYGDDQSLSPEDAIAKFQGERREQTGSDFIPHTWSVPVSVAIAKVGIGGGLIDLVSLDRPQFRPQIITERFWAGWEAYNKPTLVTFNGRGYDLPLLEMSAFRYGLSIPAWFNDAGPSYQQPRNRFNSSAHWDLQEMLTNFGATRQSGGLNLLAGLLGKPGKMDTKGDMVQELYHQGEHVRIDDYCLCDALDTYFVFLRCQVLRGALTIEQEAENVAKAEELIAERAQEIETLATYHERFQRWQPFGPDDEPFIR